MQRENSTKKSAFLSYLSAFFCISVFLSPIFFTACTKPVKAPDKTDMTFTLPEPERPVEKPGKYITDQRFLPKDKYGLVDWREVIDRGIINPASFLDPAVSADNQEEMADLVIVWTSTIKPSLSFSPIVKNIPLGADDYQYEEGIDFQRILERITFSENSPLGVKKPEGIKFILKPKVGFMADAYFPHNIHTYWLDCKNCHPKIFPISEGRLVKISMTEILKGKYCGRCHGKVAFPITDCGRCHMEHLN